MGGFRLHVLEVYNWGTFNGLARLEPLGGSALLTGANAAGKTTLVDALLTLMVPPGKRLYNQAAGGHKAEERNERTYIRGAWKKLQDVDSSSSRNIYLRGTNSHSVLLAIFRRLIPEQAPEEITLAQLFWWEGGDTLRRLYIVARTALSIAEHFSPQQPLKLSELRKQLKSAGVELFEHFSPYSRRFQHLFHLRSEKAMDLFNQITVVKDIGPLNQFIRNHMLEKYDIHEDLKELYNNYVNLTRAYAAIERAERQLAILTPLIAQADSYEDLQRRIQETEEAREFLEYYFLGYRKHLLEQALVEQQRRYEQLAASKAALTEMLVPLRDQEREIYAQIRSDEVERQLSTLSERLQRLQEERERRRREAQRYTALAQALGLVGFSDEPTFQRTREQALHLQAKIEEHQRRLIARRDELVTAKARLSEHCQQLRQAIASLQQRGSQLPESDLLLRSRLAAALQRSTEELPFVGELLRVRETDRAWEPAIQRLLRGFGRHLLVLGEYYQEVSRYVEQTDLKGHLIYRCVQPGQGPGRRGELTAQSLYHKLEIRQHANPIFATWLETELIDFYNYRCCESLEEFRSAPRALTRQGQIKHNRSRHEKDDRTPLGDPRNYVLGWDNSSKQRALIEELETSQRQLDHCTAEKEALEREQQDRQQQRDQLRRLLDVETFARLDWYAVDRECQRLVRELEQLRGRSEYLNQLKSQRAALQEAIKEKEETLRQKEQQLGMLRGYLERDQAELAACQRLLGQTPPLTAEGRERARVRIERDLKNERALSLDTLGEIKQRLARTYQQSLSPLKGNSEKMAEEIRERMRAFLETDPALRQQLDDSLAALPDYRRCYERIQKDDLPRHRAGFKALLNEKVVTSITGFQATLYQHEQAIRESLETLNAALAAVPYSASTYLQLCADLTRNQEIVEFRRALKACIPDVGQLTPESYHSCFERIQGLLKRLQSEEAWAQRVTDVRNWLEFRAEERQRGQPQPIVANSYSDSAGLNGGQKARLATSILASATAYQYQLDRPEVRDAALRLVVLDEAFGRSDQANTLLALELFRSLGFQLIVVTPLEKIAVIEPFISSCHLIVRKSEESCPFVYNMSDVQLRQYRERYSQQKELSPS
ncbi:ATP-binding protein [Thermogemmatispora tikiterensis]|nr:SbcC/MukB-like Walker B domain-containing protein [Thermogemmatispora tikiterensis]